MVSSAIRGTLASARFTPNTSGVIRWSQLHDVSPSSEAGPAMNYVLVVVAKDVGEDEGCGVGPGGKKTRAPTCLYSQIPPLQ